MSPFKSTVQAASARLELGLARRLFALPSQWQVFLSGTPPVRIEGCELEAEMQLLLRLRELRGAPKLYDGTPDEARARMREEARRFEGERILVRAVRDFTIPGPAGRLAVRHYAPPDSADPGPLLVFFHGGGYVVGDLDTHDAPCRFLCREAGVHVLSVDYRLAPEHPFPAAVEDAWAAFSWAHEHARELGADPDRVGVGGDSAGGNLSGAVALLGAKERGVSPAFQLLIYPAVDPRRDEFRSVQLFAEGFLLTRDDIRYFNQSYLGPSPQHRDDPRVALFRAPDRSGLCPAVIVTAGFDPLRDEGDAYAATLKEAGNEVVLHRFDGLIHGFINMIGVSRVAREALGVTARSLREMAAPGYSAG